MPQVFHLVQRIDLKKRIVVAWASCHVSSVFLQVLLCPLLEVAQQEQDLDNIR
jgi:hypothetical protein